MKNLPDIFLQSVSITAIVMLPFASSIGMSWVMSYENIPVTGTNALLSMSDNTIILLLMINFIFLFLGVFMDMIPVVLIFTPMFLPIVTELGIDHTHFGIIMILNLSIGLCTPTVGSVLFIGVGVDNTTIVKVIRPLMPLFIAMIVALMLLTYFTRISL